MGTVSFVAGPPVPVPLGIQTPLPYHRREVGSALEIRGQTITGISGYGLCSSPSWGNMSSGVTCLVLAKLPNQFVSLLHLPASAGSVFNFGFENALIGGNKQLRVQRDGAGEDQTARNPTTSGNDAWTVDEWGWYAGACGAWGTVPKLYSTEYNGVGDVHSPISQITTTGGIELAGSGALTSGTTYAYVNRRIFDSTPFGSHWTVAVMFLWDRELSLAELRAAQYGRPPRNGLVGEWYPGRDGLLLIRDYSGNGNDFVVTE